LRATLSSPDSRATAIESAAPRDLDADGYHAISSGFYFRSEAVRNKDLRSICNDCTGTLQCGPNNVMSGLV